MVALTYSEKKVLIDIQHRAAALATHEPILLGSIRKVAGCDVAYLRDRAAAVATVMDVASRRIVETARNVGPTPFPYIPTFLFMREAPIMSDVIRRLKTKPDLILVDGHGMAHPRRAGLAIFVGLALKLPTIGVAKGLIKGAVADFDNNIGVIHIGRRKVGYAFRDPATKKPFYASPGNRIRVDDIPGVIAHLGGGYPQALSEADRASRRVVLGLE